MPAGAATLFDRSVRDSHAGFLLPGPQTQVDRRTFINPIKAKKAQHDPYIARANATNNPGRRNNLLAAARSKALNNFEHRVIEADARVPDAMPPMSDADTQDMRDNAGGVTAFALTTLVGTNTRREPQGHGHYRRVFDRS